MEAKQVKPLFFGLSSPVPPLSVSLNKLSGADNGTVLLPGNEDDQDIMPSLPL